MASLHSHNVGLLQTDKLKNLLVNWWDERQCFARGTTSAVIADWMEDHGWVSDPLFEPKGGLLEWMRQPPSPGAIIQQTPGYACYIHDAAGVVQVSASTPAYPVLRGLVQQAKMGGYKVHRRPPPSDQQIVGDAAAWRAVSQSRELYDYLYMHQRDYLGTGHIMARHGVPDALFGWRCRCWDGLAKNRLILSWGDYSVSYRVY